MALEDSHYGIFLMTVQQDKDILSGAARTRWLRKGPWPEDGTFTKKASDRE